MNAITLAFVRAGYLGKFEAVVIKEGVKQRDAERSAKGWNASLSYRTTQQLKAQGILA